MYLLWRNRVWSIKERVRRSNMALQIPLVIAHRGFSGIAPENTLAAFKKALAINVDYLELDVHLTKDNQVVIIHDKSIDRATNGKGKVRDFTLEELRKFDAGTWFYKAGSENHP